jgi:hypothetical protein
LHATALLPAKKPGLWLHDVTPTLQLVKTFHQFAKFYFVGARLSSAAAMDDCSAIPKPTRAQKTSLHSGRKVRFSRAGIPFIAAVEDNRAPHTTTLRHSPVSND